MARQKHGESLPQSSSSLQRSDRTSHMTAGSPVMAISQISAFC